MLGVLTQQQQQQQKRGGQPVVYICTYSCCYIAHILQFVLPPCHGGGRSAHQWYMRTFIGIDDVTEVQLVTEILLSLVRSKRPGIPMYHVSFILSRIFEPSQPPLLTSQYVNAPSLPVHCVLVQ